MTPEWKYVMTIPAVAIPAPIEMADLALVGSNDDRYRALKRENRLMARYLDSFVTMFGRSLTPSIVLRPTRLPKVDTGRLCSFRNAIAVPAVIYSRALSCLSGSTRGLPCTDLFDFCPVSVSSDGSDLYIRTIHEVGIWTDVAGFRGQSTPSVVHPENLHAAFDEELMKFLLDCEGHGPKNSPDARFTTRVLRSIETAYHALRSPQTNLGSPVDFGVAMSLWVSAFETLVDCDTGDRQVRFEDVSKLIKAVRWQDQALRRRCRSRIGQRFGKARTGQRTTLPVQVYGRLYYTRNMYLHGNPLPKGKFEFCQRKGWGSLFFQVPALYRCVLMTLLTSHRIERDRESERYQGTYERVLQARYYGEHR